MSSFSIVKHFDVVKESCFCLFSTRKDSFPNTFFFECSPKTFYHRVIIAITFSAHTDLNIVLMQQFLIPGAGIFAASVRVMHQISSRLPLDERHAKRFSYQLCIMLFSHSPSNYLT